MSNFELLTQVQQIVESATESADEYSGVLGSIKEMIVSNFGQNGLIAAYIALAALVLFIVSRLAKLTFSTLKYLILPAVALAFVGTLVLPYSFVAMLPVTVTVCSLVLLFKG